MAECICIVGTRGRTRASHQPGPHHEPGCPLRGAELHTPFNTVCPECKGKLHGVRSLLVCFGCKPNRWFDRETMQPAKPPGAKLFDPTRHVGDADTMYQHAQSEREVMAAIDAEDLAREYSGLD